MGSLLIDHFSVSVASTASKKRKLVAYGGVFGLGAALVVACGALFILPPSETASKTIASLVDLSSPDQTCVPHGGSMGGATPKCWEGTLTLSDPMSHYFEVSIAIGRTREFARWHGGRDLGFEVAAWSAGDVVVPSSKVTRHISCHGGTSYCAPTPLWRAPKLEQKEFLLRIALTGVDADTSFISNATLFVEYDRPEFATFDVINRIVLLIINLILAVVYLVAAFTKRALPCKGGACCGDRAGAEQHASLGGDVDEFAGEFYDDEGGRGRDEPAPTFAAHHPAVATDRRGVSFNVWGRRPFLVAWTCVLLAALVLWNDPLLVFKYTSVKSSQFFQSVENVFEVTFVAILLLFILMEFDAVSTPPPAPAKSCACNSPQCKKFNTFALPKVLLLSVYWATFVAAYLWVTHLKHNEPLYDWVAENHWEAHILRIVGTIALGFYAAWLIYLVVKSGVQFRAMTQERQATFVYYCIAVGACLFSIVLIVVMHSQGRHTLATASTLKDVPIFTFGFNAFCWILAIMHFPLSCPAPPPPPPSERQGGIVTACCMPFGLRGGGGGSGEASTELPPRRHIDAAAAHPGSPRIDLDDHSPPMATVLAGPEMQYADTDAAASVPRTTWTIDDSEDDLEEQIVHTSLPPAPPQSARMIE